MISSATTKPKIAVPSARAAPSSRFVWTGSFRLAGDRLRCLTRCNTNANTAANTGQRCNASAQSYQTTHSSISFVITVLKFVVYSSPPMLSFMNSAVRNTKT